MDDGAARDSRGLARALLGDKLGAKEDFEAFIDWAKKRDGQKESVALREKWLKRIAAEKEPIIPPEDVVMLVQRSSWLY